LSAEQKAEL